MREELEKQVWSYDPASWTQDGLSEGISSRTLPLRESPATTRKTPDEYDVQRFHNQQKVISISIVPAHATEPFEPQPASSLQEGETEKRYRYKPLAKDEIRLLEIQPGSYGPITVSISHASLRNPPKYRALSYVWGDATRQRPVRCNNNQQVWVTENCYSALQRLRHFDKKVTFWIDAICINQRDTPERNSQVQIMATVYRKAQGITIYLGEEDQESDLAMEALEKATFLPTCAIRAKCTDPAKSQDPDVVALRNLFARPWFKRVWVLQEVRNGKFPVIICGPKTLPWRVFDNLTRFGFPRTFGLIPVPLDIRTVSRAEEKFDAEGLFRRLCKARVCLATDPRDKVFALLPLFSKVDGDGVKGFLPDYSRSTKDTFVNLAKYLLRSSEVGFSLLYATESYSSLEGLPSWVPDWSSIPRTQYIYSPEHLTAAMRTVYNTHTLVRFLPVNVLSFAATNWGIVDQIASTCNTEDPRWSRTVFEEWRNLALAHVQATKSVYTFTRQEEFYLFLGHELPEIFFGSLRAPPSWIKYAWAGLFSDFETACKNPYARPDYHQAAEALKFHLRLKETCHGQKLVMVRGESHRFFTYAITDAEVHVGDKVVQVANRPKPFQAFGIIIRKHPDSSDQYTLVGKCRLQSVVRYGALEDPTWFLIS
ncbi:HET domain-containing protein [Fusarium sp. Ph1]|nr:HET domain-containing protein [Fusarium sp. Ph1]